MKIFSIVILAVLVGVGLAYASVVAEFGTNSPIPALSGFLNSTSHPRATTRVTATRDSGLKPRLVVDEQTYEFGHMYQNEQATHVFVFRNDGPGDLKITPGKPPCKCTVSKVSRSVIPPGETAEVTLTWKTMWSSGKYKKSVPITTTDPDQPLIRIGVEGTVTPDVQFVPPTIQTYAVSQRTPAEFTTKLYSYRDANLPLSGFDFGVPETSKFFDVRYEPIAKEDLEENYALCGYTVFVTILPGMEIGPLRQDVLLKTSESLKSQLRFTVIGTIAEDIMFVGPRIDPKKKTLDLGTVKRGTERGLPLAIRVIGDNRNDVEFHVKESVPADLKFEFGPKRELPVGNICQTPLKIIVPEDMAPCNFTGEYGEGTGRIVLSTTHPDFPEIVLNVKLTVSP